MNREHLASRAKWQGQAGAAGEGAEMTFQAVFSNYLQDPYEITDKPRDLKSIYGENHGIEPDFSISSKQTGRKIFVELKRQRKGGNAHERACKYLTPGIVDAGHRIGNIRNEDFPFWIIFSGELVQDRKRRQEITFWFKGIEENLFLWEDLRKYEALKEHFEYRIRPILDAIIS